MGSTSRLSQQVTMHDDLAPRMCGIAIEARDHNWSGSKIRSEVSKLLARWQTLTDPVLNADFFRPGDLVVGNVTMGLLPITVMGTWDGLESNHRAILVDHGGTRMSVVFVSCRHARLHGDQQYETFGPVPSLERQQEADREATDNRNTATLIADHFQGIAWRCPMIAARNIPADEQPTVWVAIDDFGDGVPAGGPFESRQECDKWIGFEEQLEPREMPAGEALAGLAETRRLANEQYKAFLAKRATDQAPNPILGHERAVELRGESR